jgi:mRNA interferase MazF
MGRKIEVNQYEVFWVNLDPTEGSEIAKTRPCVVLSPDELNQHLRTAIVAPLTSTIKKYSYRIGCILNGKTGSVALDQIRTVDKIRIGSYIGRLRESEIQAIKNILREMLCD